MNQTDPTHATLTLASALSSALPADGTTTYTINEYLFPPAATTGLLDPSVTAYANYSLFLAQSIAAAGMTGEVEIWNEPPWSPDPWDARLNFYDVFPGPGIPGPLSGNMPNWGFAAALSRKSYAVPGVSYVWAGTNKSADNSLLAPGMLLNTGTLFVQPATNVKSESIHPYGNNPEDDIWSEACVKKSILPNPLKPLYFTRCNLDSNSTSNVVELEQLNLIAKILNANGGIGHSITETGFSLSGGDLAHEARFVMRQFLAYQAVGITPVEFYRLYDTSPDDLTFTNLSTNAPLPAFTAISGLMSDLAAIKGLPVTPVSTSNLPSIVSYGGFFPLDTVSIVGSRPRDTANSEVFTVWQRSHVAGAAKWATSASPAAVPVTIAIPKGSNAVAVVNLDTRAAVAFTVSSQQITFAVSDDPIEVLIEPTPPTAPTVTSIAIAPATASVLEGAVQSFSCTATLSDGTTAPCTLPVYSSSNPSIASVSNNAVTGVLPGTATITVSVTGASPASAVMTVAAPPTTVTSISITPAAASVVQGAALSFSCTAALSNGTTSACTLPVYTSSNPSIASVLRNAVTGVLPGTATITVSAAGASPASAVVTVTAPPTTVASISITPAAASVAEGAVLTLNCAATLSNGTTSPCISPVYSSSNPSIASVSNNSVTGIVPGSATITVSVTGVSPASAVVTVTAPPTTVTSISITPGGASVVEGGVLSFSCTAALSDGTTSSCSSPVYTSSNSNVASVSSNVVTGVLPGNVTITASVAGGPPPASALLTVTAPPPISGTLTVSPAAGVTYGSPVVLTETSPALAGACPTSNLIFSSGGLPLGVANLVASPISAPTSCIGTVTTTSLPVGTDQISAMSSAEGSFGPIASTATVIVAAIPGTGDTLSVGPTSSTEGSPVTIVFKLPSVPGAAVPATGSVIFASKGTTLGTAELKTTGSGTNAVTTATFLTSSLAVGTDTVTGIYGGDQNYGSANPTAMETVTAAPKVSASITLSSLTHIYNGEAQAAAVATVPAGITYDVAYNGSSNVPINAGAYSVVATITDPLYAAQTATGTLTISKEQSKLSWTPYTTVLSPDVEIGPNVLNARCSVPGEITYTAQPSNSDAITVSSASLLAVGHYSLTGACVPSDATNYDSSSTSVLFSVIRDSVFVANLSGEVSSFFDNGVPQKQNSIGGGIGVAVDPSGNLWSINSTGDSVSRFDRTGTMLSVSTGGGLSSPKALAVDASGRVWVVNGTGTISSLRTDGSPASPTAYSNPDLKGPISVSVDFKGSVWVANESSNSVTEVIGVAAPTVTPLVLEEAEPQP